MGLKQVVYQGNPGFDGEIAYTVLGDQVYFSAIKREATSSINAAEAIVRAISEKEKLNYREHEFYDIRTVTGYGETMSVSYDEPNVSRLIFNDERLLVVSWVDVDPATFIVDVLTLFSQYISPPGYKGDREIVERDPWDWTTARLEGELEAMMHISESIIMEYVHSTTGADTILFGMVYHSIRACIKIGYQYLEWDESLDTKREIANSIGLAFSGLGLEVVDLELISPIASSDHSRDEIVDLSNIHTVESLHKYVQDLQYKFAIVSGRSRMDRKVVGNAASDIEVTLRPVWTVLDCILVGRELKYDYIVNKLNNVLKSLGYRMQRI